MNNSTIRSYSTTDVHLNSWDFTFVAVKIAFSRSYCLIVAYKRDAVTSHIKHTRFYPITQLHVSIELGWQTHKNPEVHQNQFCKLKVPVVLGN